MYVNLCFILIATQTPRSPLETATSSGKTERLTMWLQNTEAEELGAWPRWAKMGSDPHGFNMSGTGTAKWFETWTILKNHWQQWKTMNNRHLWRKIQRLQYMHICCNYVTWFCSTAGDEWIYLKIWPFDTVAIDPMDCLEQRQSLHVWSILIQKQLL